MKTLAVIGDPVKHSLSPLIHNTAIKNLGLEKEYFYKIINVKKENLAKFIGKFRVEKYKGINITSPHKQNIIKYLDDTDPLALSIQAVNTVVKDKEKLIGYNTDVEGFTSSLEENYIFVKDKKVLVLGAGGAASAVVFGLLKKNAVVIIHNRTKEKASNIKNNYKNYGSIVVADNYSKFDVEIIVNATSIGMDGKSIPIDPKYLKKEHIVVDLIYYPFSSPLLNIANENGSKTLNGIDMLVNQAILAFQLFTGFEPNKEAIKEALLSQIK